MTPEGEGEAEDLQALTDNDASNDGDDNDDNETGLGGNSAKTPVSLLQVWMPFFFIKYLISHTRCLSGAVRETRPDSEVRPGADRGRRTRANLQIPGHYRGVRGYGLWSE